MSRIAFFCIPAQGHTNPTLAVVRELVRRGHEVRYYSYDMLKDKITATGAEYISCDNYDVQMNMKPEDGERIAKDIAFSIGLIVRMTLAMDDTIIADMARWQPDCIVSDSMAMWGKLAAYKLGVPFMSSTTTFAFNRYSAKIMKQSAGGLISMLLSMQKANKEVKKLQAAGYPVKDALSIIQNDNDTNTIVYTSPEFQPCAETFSDRYTFVGPSVSAPEGKAERGERKLAYISLGTVNNLKPDFYKSCIAALGGAELDVVLSVGSFIDPSSLGAAPANFTIQQRVDQIDVLRRADVFLTHCGMNSVNEALYYGVPLLLYPQTPEQSGVANRVAQLGAGTYLDKPDAVRERLFEVLSDPSYGQNAKRISDTFHRCGGYTLAADKIEALAGSTN